MLPRSTLSLVLLVCGTACVLLSMAGVMYMFHSHAAQFEESPKNLMPFMMFVGLPGGVVFITGLAMAGIGVWFGLRRDHDA
jgi:hypothetical protein